MEGGGERGGGGLKEEDGEGGGEEGGGGLKESGGILKIKGTALTLDAGVRAGRIRDSRGEDSEARSDFWVEVVEEAAVG